MTTKEPIQRIFNRKEDKFELTSKHLQMHNELLEIKYEELKQKERELDQVQQQIDARNRADISLKEYDAMKDKISNLENELRCSERKRKLIENLFIDIGVPYEVMQDAANGKVRYDCHKYTNQIDFVDVINIRFILTKEYEENVKIH